MSTDPLESLRMQIAEAPDERSRLSLLMKLSLEIVASDPKEAYAIARESLAAARALDDPRAIALAYHRLGDCCRVMGEFAEGHAYLERAERLAEGVDAREGLLSMIHRSRGLILRSQGDLPGAFERFERSLASAAEVGDEGRMATLMATIGDTYRVIGDFPKALEMMMRSLRYWESTGNDARRLGVLNDIGILYAELREHRRSIGVFEESLALCRSIGDLDTEIMVMGNLGRVHLMEGDASSALEYELAALEIYRRLGRKSEEATALFTAAMVYRKLGELDRALACDREALAIYEAIGDRIGEAESLEAIGTMEIERGGWAEGRTLLGRAVELAEELHYARLACQLHRKLAELHEREGELAASLDHYKRSLLLAIEMETGDALQAVANAEKRAELERIEPGFFEERIARLERRLDAGAGDGLDDSPNRLSDATGGAGSNGIARDPFLETLSARYPTLTPMELRVCALLKSNLATKEIAERLATSVRTVEGHRQHIRRKLGIPNGASLATALVGLGESYTRGDK